MEDTLLPLLDTMAGDFENATDRLDLGRVHGSYIRWYLRNSCAGLICLRHLIWSRAVTNRIFFYPKRLNFIRAQHVLSYHLIQVPWNDPGPDTWPIHKAGYTYKFVHTKARSIPSNHWLKNNPCFRRPLAYLKTQISLLQLCHFFKSILILYICNMYTWTYMHVLFRI